MGVWVPWTSTLHYSIFKSRILKIIFLDLSFIRLSETYLISILEKAYLDGAWQKSLASRFSNFLFLCTCFYYCNFIVGVLFFSMGWNWKVIMADSSFNLSNLIHSTEWIISWIYTTIFDMMLFFWHNVPFCPTVVNPISVENGVK